MDDRTIVQQVTSTIFTYDDGSVQATIETHTDTEHTKAVYLIERNLLTNVWELTNETDDLIEAYHQKGALLGTLSNRHIDTVLLGNDCMCPDNILGHLESCPNGQER